MSLYYLGNARSDRQRQEMIALEEAGICIFCPTSYTYSEEPEELLKYDGGRSWKKRVLLENMTWVLLQNEYPYPGALHHVLMVPKLHATKVTELPRSSWNGLLAILEEADRIYGHDQYGHNFFVFGSRNGDPRYTGATIAHLHIQFAVGDPDNKGEPVLLYMSSRPKPDGPLSV